MRFIFQKTRSIWQRRGAELCSKSFSLHPVPAAVKRADGGNYQCVPDPRRLEDGGSHRKYAVPSHECTDARVGRTGAGLKGHTRMARLVQGDVGSGKTILAFLAMIMTAENGYQSALMVPTEVLARQHYESLCTLLKENNLTEYNPRLLTGSTKAKERREIYASLEDGSCKMVIGTHALIQEKVQYKNLALVITDEQHRFGVRQRTALAEKGEPPNVLVMSATPIPRTLAIILYGDLSISVIDELPAKRLPIKNCVVDTSYRPKAYRFITRQVELGRQAYVICPMVEESEGLEAENVTDYTQLLKKSCRASQ